MLVFFSWRETFQSVFGVDAKDTAVRRLFHRSPAPTRRKRPCQGGLGAFGRPPSSATDRRRREYARTRTRERLSMRRGQGRWQTLYGQLKEKFAYVSSVNVQNNAHLPQCTRLLPPSSAPRNRLRKRRRRRPHTGVLGSH